MICSRVWNNFIMSSTRCKEIFFFLIAVLIYRLNNTIDKVINSLEGSLMCDKKKRGRWATSLISTTVLVSQYETRLNYNNLQKFLYIYT